MLSINETLAQEKINKLTFGQQLILAVDWAKNNPKQFEDSTISDTEYQQYIVNINPLEIEPFLKLSDAEQASKIKEYLENKEKEEEEKKKKEEEKSEKPKPSSLLREIKVPNVDAKFVKTYLATLDDQEYIEFTEMSPEQQQAVIEKWKSGFNEDYIELFEKFLNILTDDQVKIFYSLDQKVRLAEANLWMQGGESNVFNDTQNLLPYTKDVDPPSHFLIDKYENADLAGAHYYEYVNDYKIMSNGITKYEFKKRYSRMTRARLWIGGRKYNLLNAIFDIERTIAEENKHMQEMVRGIVDTGPDYNERAVFAQLVNGRWLTYKGEEVPEFIVKKQRKLALENPSRFQALCHYELSKREETEQWRLWDEIFDMMAEEGYAKTHMYGVIVGLQFMNKPMYLAYKQGKLEYAAEYVIKKDEHGHDMYDSNGNPIPETDDENKPKLQYYTQENMYEMVIGVGGRGIKRVKRDADGRKVRVGDVVRSTSRVRFATEDLLLQPGEFEYDQKLPNGEEMYPTLTRVLKDKNGVPLKDEEGNVRTETYKVKKILAVKRMDFAHEIAAKFASYQYGFRSADVAITLDVARKAYQDSLSCIRAGDTKSIKFQESQYVLSRLHFVVSASRYGGNNPGEDGKGPSQSAETAQQQAKQMEVIAKAQEMRDKGMLESEVQNFISDSLKGGGKASWPARISGTAEAIVFWEELAKVTDKFITLFPNAGKILKSDYHAQQTEFRTEHTFNMNVGNTRLRKNNAPRRKHKREPFLALNLTR